MTYASSGGWLGTLAATARRDRLLQATVVFYVAVGLVLPRLEGAAFVSSLCHLGILLFVLASFVRVRVQLERPEERCFWRRMALAYLCWTAGAVLTLHRDLLRAFPGRALQVVAYAFVYVFMIRAIEGQPHRDSPPRRAGLERLLTWPSVTFFVFGLVVYFVFVPLVLDWKVALDRRDEFYFYTLLDLYLSIRFLLLARSASASGRWRSIYAALALPWIALVFLADFSMLAARTPFEWPAVALPVWWLNLPLVLQTLANGLRHSLGAGGAEPPAMASNDELSFVVSARTLALGVAFPVLHIAVTRLDLVVAPDHRSRPALVLIWLVFFGLVAVIRHRHLERSAQQLWLDRVTFEEELRSSEQDLRLMIEKGRAEEMLQASEKKIDFAFRSCPYPLVITSLRDGRFIETNAAFEETFGYGRDEVVGYRFDELGLWLDPEHIARVRRLLEHGREIREVEVAFRRKSDEKQVGEERRGLLSAAEITLQEEPCLLSIVYDVTEQARSLEELGSTVRAAGDSGAVIFEIDAGGRIRSWNRGAVNLCGWSEGEALGKRWSEIVGLAGAEAMAEAEAPEWNGRLELMTRDGDLVEVTAWSTVLDEGGSKLVVGHAG